MNDIDRKNVINYSAGGGEQPVGLYLPNSDSSKVICECYPENYDVNSLSWGYGKSPMVFNGPPPTLNQSVKAVYFPSYTRQYNSSPNYANYGLVYLGGYNPTFTVYIVCQLNLLSVYSIISSCKSASGDNGPNLTYSNGNDPKFYFNTGSGTYGVKNIASGTWIVGYISANMSTKKCRGGDLSTFDETSFAKEYGVSNTNFYISIAHDTIMTAGKASNLYVRYVGVTSNYESRENIRANLENLKSVFIDNY